MTGTSTNPITIKNNYAQEGGAIYIRDTVDSVITGVTFSSNQASFKGGIFAVINPNPGTQGSVSIVSSTLTDTKAVSGI